jgi:CBS domain-containing protein
MQTSRAGASVKHLPKDASAVEAARLMLVADVDELRVVEGDEVIGVVTERDLVSKVMAKSRDPARTRVVDVCSPAR